MSFLEPRRYDFLSSDYPLQLRELLEPPASLFVQGKLTFDERPILAVVGSRDSSAAAEAWMRRELAPIAPHVVLLSGGARGIDETAHRVALDAKTATAVILPSGLDKPYPAHWQHWRDRVIEYGGCMVSEYEPGTVMYRGHFEKRNRLIAALADVVLIVEARPRSGTAITVRHAQKMNRDILAVPWFPGDTRGELCNELIRSKNALMVTKMADVWDHLRAAARMRIAKMKCLKERPELALLN